MSTQSKLELILQIQAEIKSLRAEIASLTQVTTKPALTTTRRKVLGRLAVGILAIGGASLAHSQGETQARVVTKPSSRIGFISMPHNTTYSGNLPSATASYGLATTSETQLDLAKMPNVNTSVSVINSTSQGIRIITNNMFQSAICRCTNGVGLASNSNSGRGVVATSNTKYGVLANSASGRALRVHSDTGAALTLAASPQPTNSPRFTGDLYVGTGGNLHMWNGSVWKVFQVM